MNFGGTSEVLFAGYLVKAGDDNSRWKSRYFQLIGPKPSLVVLPAGNSASSSSSSSSSSNRASLYSLRYFENDRDAGKPGKSPRGEILVSDVVGISVFPSKSLLPPAQPLQQQASSHPSSSSATLSSSTPSPPSSSSSTTTTMLDGNVQLLGELTSDHTQDGPTKLMIFCRDRLWRLAELTLQANAVGELIRALDRILTHHHISRFSVRMVGWMRAQGSLSWNRRYAMLFSNGELLMFLDPSLDHLRRRIDLAKAVEIRPKQPLASSGSMTEKRVLRLLNLSIQDASSNVWSVDMSDILGIRLMHPLIPEKTGYIMCVERSSLQEDSAQLYARFRKWIVQLQLSAAESRLSGFVDGHDTAAHPPAPSSSSGAATTSGLYSVVGGGAHGAIAAAAAANAASSQQVKFTLEADEDSLLERKLAQLYQQSNPTEVSRTIAWEYLVRFGAFPALHRSSLWFVLFNGQSMRRAAASSSSSSSYAALVAREEGRDADEMGRLRSALGKVDAQMDQKFVPSLVHMLLQQGGEEAVFWTYLGMVSSNPHALHTSSSNTGGAPRAVDNSTTFLRHQQGFALLVEAHVIVDLLGMKHPQVIAHLSSYELTRTLLKHLSEDYLPQLGAPSLAVLPQIWDGASVVGAREALNFGTVHLLATRAGEMVKCYHADELLGVVRRALSATSSSSSTPLVVRFPWKDFDSQLLQRLRRAQWNGIVAIMREHSQMLRLWKLVAGECRVLVTRAVAQCNRFGGSAAADHEEDVDRVHAQAVQLQEVGSSLFTLAETCEHALEHRMLQSMGGGAGGVGGMPMLVLDGNSGGSDAGEEGRGIVFGGGEGGGQVAASGAIVQVEQLAAQLTCFGMTCVSLGWKVWCKANQMASQHHFIPRASLASSFNVVSMPLLSSSAATAVGAAASSSSSSTTVSPTTSAPGGGGGQPPSLQYSLPPTSTTTTTAGATSAGAGASMGAAAAQQQQQQQSGVTTSGGTGGSSLAGNSGAASSTTNTTTAAADDAQAGDMSSIKILANEIRRRLFNQTHHHHLPPGASSSSSSGHTVSSSTANSGPPSPTTGEKAPACPMLDPASSPQFLLAKFNGGFIGLCDFAGSSVDAAFAKDKQLRNVKLIRLLDVLDVMIKMAAFACTLHRWLQRRCAGMQHSLNVKRSGDMPASMQHLFLPSSSSSSSPMVQFDADAHKLLDDALQQLHQRCSSGAKNCVV